MNAGQQKQNLAQTEEEIENNQQRDINIQYLKKKFEVHIIR
jgi:hypothetical protein